MNILPHSAPMLVEATRNWDLVKLTVGPFVGATFAFVVARYNDARKLHRERVAAGNLALLTLRDQIDDYLGFRKSFRYDVANPARGPNAPVFMLAQATFQAYAESSIDFPSLSFLMERRKHIPKLNSMVYSAKLYRNLVKSDRFRNEAVLELQKKLAEAHTSNPPPTRKDIERILGPLLIANATSAIIGLAFHAKDDERTHRQAVDELRAALIDELGPWWWPNWARKRWPMLMGPALISFTNGDPEMQEDAMPAFPKQLLAAMEEQEAAEGKHPEADAPLSFFPLDRWHSTYYLVLRKIDGPKILVPIEGRNFRR
ncbi:hypothetical protein [Janthinobacterium sp. 75]|uniref:hypothetical protein n=1 Tax=Janthinobacterium sp. 75 TaxID=2135628 RepID=UPI001064107F|nr:hypothetical protein [Janthinobacterium sp. 75]TDY36843.1 hypothetical protein C8C89_4748 [Janthinobacterium sp. 75]